MRLPVLLFFALAVPACRSSEEGRSDPAKTESEETTALTPNRVVITPRSDTVADKAPRYYETKSEEWFEEELRQLEVLLRDGMHKPALERAYAALEFRPKEAQRRALQDFVQRANTEVLRLDTIEASITADRDPIQFGDPVRVRVRLKNLSGKPIRLAGATKNRSGSLFALDVTRRAFDTRAQVMAVRRRVYRNAPEDMEMEPHGTAELVLDLGVLDNNEGLAGFRTYTVSGTLRPSVLEVGGLNRWDAIRIRGGTVRSFRPGYKHLTDDPVRRIGQAIEKSAPTHLMTAAGLVPLSRRQAAVDILVEKVRGDRILDLAIFGALHYLTEVRFNRDAEAWKAWWPRVRERYFATAGDRKRKAPSFRDD